MSAKLRTTMKLLGHHLVIQTSDQQVTTPALIMEQSRDPKQLCCHHPGVRPGLPTIDIVLYEAR